MGTSTVVTEAPGPFGFIPFYWGFDSSAERRKSPEAFVISATFLLDLRC